MRILLTGRSGQIGGDLLRLLRDRAAGSFDLRAVGRDLLDLSDPDRISSAVRAIRPDLILNAAAYTAVDRAEEESELATAVNGRAPGLLGEEAKHLGAAIVHYSTDYVFDGSGDSGWTEEDVPAPMSAYGRSKLLGERTLEASHAAHLTFRVAWVYSHRPGNFLTKMLELMGERDALSVVADEIGAPTWSRDIAGATVAALEAVAGPVEGWTRDRVRSSVRERGGLYHLAPAGETSWYGFAEEIRHRAGEAGMPLRVRDLTRISGDEWPSPVRRPRNSRLSAEKLARELGVRLPDWRVGVEGCMARVASERTLAPA